MAFGSDDRPEGRWTTATVALHALIVVLPCAAIVYGILKFT